MSSNNSISTTKSEHISNAVADDWILGFGHQDGGAPIDNAQNLNSKYQAKQQLIHALLQAIYQDKNSEVQEEQSRISEVLSTISEPKELLADKSNSQHKFAQWFSLAASICLMTLVMFSWLSPTNVAIAEVNNILTRLRSLEDRIYTISVLPVKPLHLPTEKTDVPNYKTLRSRNENSDVSIRHSASIWLNGAKLYVRGDNQYVLIAETSEGYLLRARNRQHSWKLNHDNEVKYYDDHAGIKVPIAGDAVALVFMDVPQMLTHLADNYNLTYKKNAGKDSESKQVLSMISANKKSKQLKGAKQINIFYHPDSYLIDRFEFDRVHLQGHRKRYKVSLQLVDLKALVIDFFDAEHHQNKSKSN